VIEGLDIKPGEVSFVEVRHDAWCRAQWTQCSSDCCCNPETVLVDEQTFVAGVQRWNRARRRAAEREARRAIKRAGRRS
jgi:hypothetical protein